jgi:hypothetical protein
MECFAKGKHEEKAVSGSREPARRRNDFPDLIGGLSRRRVGKHGDML